MQVTALRPAVIVVARGGVEPPTFRFSVGVSDPREGDGAASVRRKPRACLRDAIRLTHTPISAAKIVHGHEKVAAQWCFVDHSLSSTGMSANTTGMGTFVKTVTRSVTKTPRDGAAPLGRMRCRRRRGRRRMVTGETDQVLWDRVRLAHNPEVAGSNPAPATNVSTA
jgi:hypothetical protein